MIQRIQSLYLFITSIISGILPLFIPLWKNNKGNSFYFTESLTYIIFFGLSAILSLISILLFKNRQNQFVLNRLNIILNFILIGLLVYRTLNLSGDASVSEKGIGMLLPVFSILLLVFANKAIKKDEDLVKSVDRLR